MAMRWMGVLVLLCCWSASGLQAVVTVPDEPANLDSIKQQLKKYRF